MNVIFKTLKMHNFMSFEDAELSLDNNGFVFVKGSNNNSVDFAESNGSGKSAIFESISYCLTGSTLRGAKDVVRHNSECGCLVELNFSIDNDNYKIVRTKDHKEFKTNLFLYVNDENKSGKGIRDTELLLKQYLPDLNSELLNSVIILGQGLPQRFTNNTPSGRKDVLESLSKSDFMIEDLKEKTNARYKYLTDKKSQMDKKLTEQVSMKNVYESQKSSANDKLNNMSSIDDTKESLSNCVDDIKTNNFYLNELNKNLSEVKSTDELYESLNSLQKKFNEKKNELHDEFTSVVDSMKTEKNELNSSIKILSNEIVRLDSVTDICPTCGQKLPNVEKIDTTDKKEELTKLKFRYNELSEKISDEEKLYNDKVSVEEKKYMEDCSVVNEELSSVKKQKSDIENEIRTFTNLNTSLSSKVSYLESEISNYETLKKSYVDCIIDCDKNIDECNSNIDLLNSTILDISSHIEVVNKFLTALKRDFRGYLLTNVIDYINIKAKEYCKYIFNTEEINFVLDGNNISISYNGKEYESLSGGEKQKIDLIIQFAIRDMLCNYLNFSCNILVLDELTDNLDSLGCQQLINFVSTKLSDINSIYIISHRVDLDIPCDVILNVEKSKNGVSNIV